MNFHCTSDMNKNISYLCEIRIIILEGWNPDKAKTKHVDVRQTTLSLNSQTQFLTITCEFGSNMQTTFISQGTNYKSQYVK